MAHLVDGRVNLVLRLHEVVVLVANFAYHSLGVDGALEFVPVNGLKWINNKDTYSEAVVGGLLVEVLKD